MKKALSILVLLLIISPYVAFAQQAYGPGDQEFDSGFICKFVDSINDIGPDYGLGDCVRQVYNFALSISGLIAMGTLVYAGYLYMTAGGDGEQISHAKEMIGGAIAGIIILATAFIVLKFLNPNLVDIKRNPTSPSSSVACRPSVSITSPANQATLSSSSVVFNMAASGPSPINRVELISSQVGGAAIRQYADTTAPYSITVDLAPYTNGQYIFQAQSWTDCVAAGAHEIRVNVAK